MQKVIRPAKTGEAQPACYTACVRRETRETTHLIDLLELLEAARILPVPLLILLRLGLALGYSPCHLLHELCVWVDEAGLDCRGNGAVQRRFATTGR